MYGMTPVGVFFIAFFPLVIMIRHFVNSPNLARSLVILPNKKA